MKPVAMFAKFVCASLLFSSGASFRRGGGVFQYRVISTKNTVFYYPKKCVLYDALRDKYAEIEYLWLGIRF